MAEVVPFVATRYSAELYPVLDRLLTPPYDVIDARMKEAFYAAHPYNIIRVDFGKDFTGDNEFENRYTRASATWQQWKQERIIVEDPKRAFYVYEQEFSLPDGRRLRRRGFFGAVKLQDYNEGGIRAHEQTFDGPKADRFRLMRTTHCNLSPIFCIYDDAERTADRLLAEGIAGQPPVETTVDGIVHRLWALTQPALQRKIMKAMAPLTLFIADGHHRYETCLLYRDEMRAVLGRANGRQPFDYTMMYMNNIHDEGLVILPTHRILSKEISLGVDSDEALGDLSEHFDLVPLPIRAEGLDHEAARLGAMLAEAGARRPAFVMLLPKRRAYLLTLKEGVNVAELIEDEQIPDVIRTLDVTLLHRHIIGRVWLGNPELDLDDQDVLYEKDAARVLAAMQGCKYGVAFLLNPTRIEQVCAVAREGLRMPHKSTYFYPKLLTGLVMRDMNLPW